MLQTRYLAQIRELIDRLESTQPEAVDAAAATVAAALATGHAFFVSPLGHGNEGDLLHRAGGLLGLRPFSYQFSVSSPLAEKLHDRPRPEAYDADLEPARLAVRASELRPGDCLIVGSVSGRSAGPVCLGLAAREAGVRVIALTALEYARRAVPAHRSGKLLHEVADHVLDNCVPYGDACLEVEGLAAPVFPLSGIATTLVAWMLCAQVLEKLLARGLSPQVYLSANRPDGPAFNDQATATFNQVGY